MLPIITPPPLLTTATPPLAANLHHPLRVARGFGLRPPPLPRPPRWRSPTAWFACFALAAAGLHAQVIIALPGTPVTENFDALGSAEAAALPAYWLLTAAGVASPTWDDPGNVTTTTKQASSGSPTAAGRYNWGQSATDRAIGFMTSSSFASPNSILARFSNQTGATISQVTASFDYERYRLNTSAASVSFFYSTDGANWTSASSGDSGAFSTGASTYGFDPLISSVARSAVLADLNLAPGAELYLRWTFVTNGANSQGIGLDNFSLTASAVPEPSTYAALAGTTTLLAAFWHRRRSRRPRGVPACI